MMIPQDVLDAAQAAYSDCNGAKKGPRNLRFKLDFPLSDDQLLELMPLVVENGYNEFDSKTTVEMVTALFGPLAKYYLARESSVCIYVKTKSPVAPLDNIASEWREFTLIDEFSKEGDEYRLWWD